MSINFIPNDPLAGPTAPGKRVQTKRKTRPATRAGFTFSNASPDGTFEPVGPVLNVFRRCRRRPS